MTIDERLEGLQEAQMENSRQLTAVIRLAEQNECRWRRMMQLLVDVLGAEGGDLDG